MLILLEFILEILFGFVVRLRRFGLENLRVGSHRIAEKPGMSIYSGHTRGWRRIRSRKRSSVFTEFFDELLQLTRNHYPLPVKHEQLSVFVIIFKWFTIHR